MKSLPDAVEPYRRTPTFTEATVPSGLTSNHQTKSGVWGSINVLSGRLRYVIPSAGESVILEPGTPGIVEPTVAHRVEPLGPVSFFVEFWR